MRITVLAENTSCDASIKAEHGLSLYIEANGKRLLFDMGQTTLFAENARRLGVNLSDIDFSVVSHGHYDHGGGLGHFLQINKTAPVYISRHAFSPHYNGTEKYIGLDASLSDSKRLIYTDGETEIQQGFVLYSCNTSEKKHRDSSEGMNLFDGTTYVPDDFRHEQYLLVTEQGRRVLISGCSHKGILNLIDWFCPDVFIGGFHLSKRPLDDDLKSCATQLSSYGTSYYTCHCTGASQYEYMKEFMPDLSYLSGGQTVEI